MAARLVIISPEASSIETKPTRELAGNPVEGSVGFVTVVTDCWLVVDEGVDVEVVGPGDVVEVGVTH